MLKIKDGFVLRKIGPQTVAVPVGKRTGDIHGVISLSDSGAILWERLTKGAEKEELIDTLLEEYEIDRKTAVSDIEEFIDGLKMQGVMEE